MHNYIHCSTDYYIKNARLSKGLNIKSKTWENFIKKYDFEYTEGFHQEDIKNTKRKRLIVTLKWKKSLTIKDHIKHKQGSRPSPKKKCKKANGCMRRPYK